MSCLECAASKSSTCWTGRDCVFCWRSLLFGAMPADAPNEGILTGRRSWVTPHLQVAFGDDVLFFLFARGFDSSVNHSRSVQNDGLASEFVRSVFRSYESATLRLRFLLVRLYFSMSSSTLSFQIRTPA